MSAAIEPTYSHRPTPDESQDLTAGRIVVGTSAASAKASLALRIKRSLDIAVGIIAGAVALPAMLLIGTAIRLDSPGPALFRAKRIGQHGKLFSMYKFRTMVHGAEERLHEVAHLNVANGMVKIPDDPRVTRIGKWLRRFSLDELPQLYNVVAGHMSLVGPRPHDVHDIPHHDLENEPRLAMRPGLTGLWQVSARSDPNLENRIRWDLHYVNNWSLRLDAELLAKTVPVVLLAKGGHVDRSLQPEVRADRPQANPTVESSPAPTHSMGMEGETLTGFASAD